MAIDIDKMFSYQRPTVEQATYYEYLREEHKKLAAAIMISCPDSAERTLAIRALHLCNMHANSAIALNGSE
jgi:hypothetical protein